MTQRPFPLVMGVIATAMTRPLRCYKCLWTLALTSVPVTWAASLQAWAQVPVLAQAQARDPLPQAKAQKNEARLRVLGQPLGS